VLLPGYTHVRTVWVSPRVVPWVAPASLVLVFLLLFLTWVGVPGSSDIYQTGWGTAFGTHNSALGIFHMLFFWLALLLAVASVVLTRVRVDLPPWARQLWPWRSAIVGGVATLALLFLLLELFKGLGLEQAAQTRETTRTVAEGELAKGLGLDQAALIKDLKVTPEAWQVMYYLLHRTFWLDLAVLFSIVAVAGAALEFWLALRKSRPLPRVDISW
jgi:hypothetical protein